MTGQYGARDGETAVVTGASRGIGAAACRHLREQGFRVVGVARRRSPQADLSFRVDVADPVQVEGVFAGLPAPALVVHAAGVLEPVAALAQSEPRQWAENVAVNLLGTYHVVRFALPPMIEAGRGLIIHLSSGAASHVIHSWSAYSAAKAGAEQLVRSVAEEIAGTGVAVCALNPGITETPMQEVVRASEFPERDRFLRVHEERSGHTPDEVAAALCRLLGRPPDELNGRVFQLDEV